MKLKKKRIILPLVILFIAFLFISYRFSIFNFHKGTKANIPKDKSGFFLGTYVNIKIYNNTSDKIFDNVFNILKDIENKMSININTSEVSKINQNAGKESVTVSPETFAVIKKGQYYSNLSKGHFDISIGPLVKLWGIGSDHAKVPTPAEINQNKVKINYKNIVIDDKSKSVKLSNNGMMIDLGGIAKGYVADQIAQYLKSQDVKKAIINLGGNIFTLGSKPNGDSWNIGVQNPFKSRGEYIGILHVKDKSIVTSGVYERFLEKDGKRYHHILSPFTGYPVNNSLMSTTIISNKSIDGDALSTTAFSLGLADGMKLIESLDGIEAIFVNEKKEVYITSGLKNKFNLTNENFKLIY
ncbi:FAD:protein FMN transferase [Haloimpatiens sp. FM7330]|uniref:FAD:protein FMN transferase n=1 Tax=Haloimpatiens sp. FM7330 TaxID=3298610 RepID=UPI0036435DDC